MSTASHLLYNCVALLDRCRPAISTHTSFPVPVGCGVRSGNSLGDCGQSAACRPELMIVDTTDTAVGWLTLGEQYGRFQVAVFAGGERNYGSLHGRCNATHADRTVLARNTH